MDFYYLLSTVRWGVCVTSATRMCPPTDMCCAQRHHDMVECQTGVQLSIEFWIELNIYLFQWKPAKKEHCQRKHAAELSVCRRLMCCRMCITIRNAISSALTFMLILNFSVFSLHHHTYDLTGKYYSGIILFMRNNNGSHSRIRPKNNTYSIRKWICGRAQIHFMTFIRALEMNCLDKCNEFNNYYYHVVGNSTNAWMHMELCLVSILSTYRVMK